MPGESIDGSIFQDEANKYVHILLGHLKKRFVCVAIESVPKKMTTLPSGRSFVFWVAGDGTRTFVYRTSGNAEVLGNDEFIVVGVYGADKTMTVDGRIKYLPNEGTEWIDLGPITPYGKSADDMSVSAVLKNYTKEFDELEGNPELTSVVDNSWFMDEGF